MNNKYKTETGRSMVEIIGVLAVVGVLSIGGIAAYSYAVDKHNANETTRALISRAIDIQTQIEQCKGDVCEVSIDAWQNEPTPFTITLEDDGLLHVEKIPARVCKMIGDLLENTAAVYVENVQYDPKKHADPCQSRKEHSMYFSFDPDVLADLEDSGEFTIPVTATEAVHTSDMGEETDTTTTAAYETDTPETEPTTTTTAAQIYETKTLETEPTTTTKEQVYETNTDAPETEPTTTTQVYETDTPATEPTTTTPYETYDWDTATYQTEPTTTRWSYETSSDMYETEPTTTTAMPYTEPETTDGIAYKAQLKMEQLARNNPGCPAPYYDSATRTIYFYDAYDYWDPCWQKTCTWETIVNDWACAL